MEVTGAREQGRTRPPPPTAAHLLHSLGSRRQCLSLRKQLLFRRSPRLENLEQPLTLNVPVAQLVLLVVLEQRRLFLRHLATLLQRRLRLLIQLLLLPTRPHTLLLCLAPSRQRSAQGRGDQRRVVPTATSGSQAERSGKRRVPTDHVRTHVEIERVRDALRGEGGELMGGSPPHHSV